MKRLFAALWSRVHADVDATLGPAKEHVFRDIPAQILEIGPGVGSNFHRYPDGTRVIAYEPNPHMHKRLEHTAAEHGIVLDLRSAKAESLLEPDASQDVVIATLTLCSVDDPATVIAEVHRVLRPGGRFLFVEHIAAAEGTALRYLQGVLAPIWAVLSDRCRLAAHTNEEIERAGFAAVDYTIENLGAKLDPSRRIAYGVATR